jgi:K+-transporting ATPase ATPase C chain
MKHVVHGVLMLLVMTALTGIAYPLLMTGAANVLFPRQADGSLIEVGGRIVGSRLIGQPFDDPGYFWGRPSATGPVPYNGAASSGSNWGPLHDDLVGRVEESVAALQAGGSTGSVPVDLVTTSGSGLDPHMTPAAALYQIPRVASARGIDEAVVRELVERHREGRQFGILGEPRVNVLELNLALDALSASGGRAR